MLDKHPQGERYANLTPIEIQQVDEFVLNLKNVLVNKDTHNHKQCQLKIQLLEEKLKELQNQQVNLDDDKINYLAQLKHSDILSIIKQNEDLKKALEIITDQLQNINQKRNLKSNKNQPVQNINQIDNQIQNQNQDNDYLAKWPEPIPGIQFNYKDISTVKSYRLNQIIPAQLIQFQNDSGFDVMLSKFQVSQLQIMNIELMHIVSQKEKENLIIKEELEEMRNQFKQCLLIQDNLYEQYFEKKEEFLNKNKILQKQIDEKSQELLLVQQQIQEYIKNQALQQNNNQGQIKQRIQELTLKNSKLEICLVRLNRQYQCIKDEYNEMSESYQNYSVEFCEKEKLLLNKIHQLMGWKSKAQHYLKTLLIECNNSIPKSDHNELRNQLDKYIEEIVLIKEKMLHINIKYNKQKILKDKYLKKVGKHSYQKMNQWIHNQNQNYQIKCQKNRILYLIDSKLLLVKQLRQCKKKISPNKLIQKQSVNQLDQTYITLEQFKQVFQSFRIDLKPDEVEIIFKFIDNDGNNMIELQEFIRKAKRMGLTVRSHHDEIIYELWDQFKQAGITLDQAFTLFDQNKEGQISKQEMMSQIQILIKEIKKETIDYIFQIADTSGDGKITYSEFFGLFENNIQELIRQEAIKEMQDLSWEKNLALKIDEKIHQKDLYIKDLYTLLDMDNNDQISLEEFFGLFQKLEIQIEDEDAKLLFQDIDADNSGYIEYNELINYIRKAQSEKIKIIKMQKIQNKIQQISKDFTQKTQEFLQLQEGNNNQISSSLSREERFEIDFQLIQLKNKALVEKSECLELFIARCEKDKAKLELQIKDLEEEQKSNGKKIQELLIQNNILVEQGQNVLKSQKIKQVHALNQKLIKQNLELKNSNNTLNTLYQFASDQVKQLLVSNQKIQYEFNTLRDLVKFLQSLSDENVVLGKIQHQLMISRFNQGLIGCKYEKVLSQFEQAKTEIINLEGTIQELETENIENREILRQKISFYEQQISGLRKKIIPCINMGKIERMYRQICELSTQKSNLEIQNNKIRNENNELNIKCDYFEYLEQGLQEMKNFIKIDQNEEFYKLKVIQYATQVNELKILEFQLKKDRQINIQQQEFYQKQMRQHIEHQTYLEVELDNVNKKIQQREIFWQKNMKNYLIFQQEILIIMKLLIYQKNLNNQNYQIQNFKIIIMIYSNSINKLLMIIKIKWKISKKMNLNQKIQYYKKTQKFKIWKMKKILYQKNVCN
ncbi:hypothetical protein IMG5_119470 [Ichthyophthirius multifiliis]|uniref:EF-hand domain-containing protein n=1 Tax=Ichthyophthirius multifiliis TaxID=5932 RepID=G0QUU6_ICHMU|nr:hypothetical protein IMG5_119470 [Ichthyophthirius multifiliis]EGR31006.1 hypothetical protein IMG5_119470 [Ichthyophthirius multifiliis]|eukprot:XP_004034492.1 hypothetical protein IMG5_119470 [Ichthyophthirius multifiliis]